MIYETGYILYEKKDFVIEFCIFMATHYNPAVTLFAIKKKNVHKEIVTQKRTEKIF